jgi:hypothetical protein
MRSCFHLGKWIQTHSRLITCITVHKTFLLLYFAAGKGIDPEKLREAIQISEEKYYSVYAALKDAVEITHDYEVEEVYIQNGLLIFRQKSVLSGECYFVRIFLNANASIKNIVAVSTIAAPEAMLR